MESSDAILRGIANAVICIHRSRGRTIRKDNDFTAGHFLGSN